MIQEQLDIVEDISSRVHSMVIYNANKVDASDIPEFIANEIIDLTEWMSPDAELNRVIAHRIVDKNEYPQGTKAMVKQYFDLAY